MHQRQDKPHKPDDVQAKRYEAMVIHQKTQEILTNKHKTLHKLVVIVAYCIREKLSDGHSSVYRDKIDSQYTP